MFQIGQVFTIPIDNEKYGLGQLIAYQRPIYYMVAYDFCSSVKILPTDLNQLKVLFLGNFFDVLLQNDRWKLLCKMPIPTVPFPCYKIKRGDKFYIENWSRSVSREATDNELHLFQFRGNHGPIILENALKWHFGFHEKEQIFDSLSVKYIEKVSRCE